MRQKIARNVVNVEQYCKRQTKLYGATKCEPLVQKDGGKWDVLVEYPEQPL